MSLYNTKKLEHKAKQVGKFIGAQSNLNNYEHGREKAKKIAISKALHKHK